jgi:hypothetical protein
VVVIPGTVKDTAPAEPGIKDTRPLNMQIYEIPILLHLFSVSDRYRKVARNMGVVSIADSTSRTVPATLTALQRSGHPKHRVQQVYQELEKRHCF